MTDKRDLQRALEPLRQRLRESLLKMWRVRGGGFYGLGFVVFFVGAQGVSLLQDLIEATGPVDFVTSQVLEGFIRLIGDTPWNFIRALLWPLQLLSWLGSWGLLPLLAGFIAFDRWVKPWLNDRYGLAPEPAPDEPPG
ncbi:MAG: hypothetical protein AAGG11_19205 [Pseudomonadota bacterium]